ncbi:hypothetical protein K151_1993 [Proteus hauseri ZMd44]|nr:hypothetical protein K151_1993 [Proteus hauseri ZMd44]
MTEADIYSILSPVLPDKVFPYVAPQSNPAITAPWCVFSLYDVKGDVLKGQAETMTNIQVDVYADTIDEARTLRLLFANALTKLSPVEISEKQDYEPDTGLFRATFECQVWQ